MRTKMLVFAAAAMTAGFLTAYAQTPVYSVNIVGYVNVPLTNGLNLIANQLDVDGYGTNNTLLSVFGTNTLPNLTRVYVFNGSSYVFATYSGASHTWVGSGLAAANAAMQPGAGVFVSYPQGQTPTNLTITGTVLQGSVSNNVALGYQILGSQVPQGGYLITNLAYTPGNLDRVYQWNALSQGYGSPHTYSTGSHTWINGEPQISVGEAFFIQGHAGSTWTRNFTVN